MRRLMFLGTGTSQGVPVIACDCEVCASADPRDSRLRTSALLTVDGADAPSGQPVNLLFDIGPDFRCQMLAHGVRRIDAILLTHAHRDHVAGLDDVRPLNYRQHSPIDLYLNAEAARTVRRDYHYIFSPHQYPGLPEITLHEVDAPFLAAGLEVIPIHAMHKDLPVLGYRVGNMAYITDANHIAPAEMERLQGLELLVINALRKEKHWSHYSLPEALDVIAKVSPKRAYLTHVSHEMGLQADVQHGLPEGVWLAYDNLTVTI